MIKAILNNLVQHVTDFPEDDEIMDVIYHLTNDITGYKAGYYVFDFVNQAWEVLELGGKMALEEGSTFTITGDYEGQLFFLTENNGSYKAGLYRFDGSVWRLKLTMEDLYVTWVSSDEWTAATEDEIEILRNKSHYIMCDSARYDYHETFFDTDIGGLLDRYVSDYHEVKEAGRIIKYYNEIIVNRDNNQFRCINNIRDEMTIQYVDTVPTPTAISPALVFCDGDLFVKTGSAELEAGLYQNGVMVMSWAEIKAAYPGAFATAGSIIGRFDESFLDSLEGDLVIGNDITSIGEYGFYGCDLLTSITIPSSVTSIGSWAFEACSSFTSIEVPNSVTSIGEGAFMSCNSLTSIVIGNGVTSIEQGVFGNCYSLISIDIPNSITNIGYSAFSYCTSLTSITIPNSVTSIDGYTFYGCTSLTDFNYNGTINEWNSITLGTDWNKDCPFTVVHCTDGDVTI